jgi:hypothetical protein
MMKAFHFFRRSCVAIDPTPPAPPTTSTRSTLVASELLSRKRAPQQVRAPTGSEAQSKKDSDFGTWATSLWSTVKRSAQQPYRRTCPSRKPDCDWRFYSILRHHLVLLFAPPLTNAYAPSFMA